jgi:GT2 family glycosyltransferase/glycosyltransferase involved in cell wall biosynthesis
VNNDRSAAVQHAFSCAAAASFAGDFQTAALYYEYAQRSAPSDGDITMAIGATRLALQDPRASEPFELIAKRDDVREAWLGLTAVRNQQGHNDLAVRDLRELLSRFGCSHDAGNLQMFDIVARTQGNVGWCGLTADGILHVTLLDPLANLDSVVVTFDGVPVGSRPRTRSRDGDYQRSVHRLPDAWREASRIAVCLKTRHLLGSKLHPASISRVEGFVGVEHGCLTGWAWHPHDPECAPTLTIRDANGRTLRIAAREPAPEVAHQRPLAKPRRLYVAATDLHGFVSPIAVLDAGGRHLYGSPLDPQADKHSAAGAAELARRMFPASARTPERAIELPLPSVPADIIGPTPIAKRTAQSAGIDVVIPVYRGRAQTLACIKSVLASLPKGARWGARCIVVEDASPEPALTDALSALAARGRIVLRRQRVNLGFPATANAGIRVAAGRDVILLNSDTLVPPGWIERLSAAAYSAPDIGTATPFSNDATIFSYPREDAPNPVPDEAAAIQFDRLAARANGSDVTDVPSAHGFCVYLRRDCLATVGLLRADLFAQGYGEENDFCIRARHLGWRHVAVPGVFVAHAGAGSFGGAKAQLMARNLTILNRLHPGYDALIAAFRQADPLARARFRMDALRWRNQRSRKGSVILITHGRTGGVKRHVAERCKAIAASGLRPIVLSPVVDAQGRTCCQLSDASGEEFPNLRFATNSGLADLVGFLRDDKPVRAELHHFIGHDPALFGLPQTLNVPYDVVVHDYAWICPRITLVGPDKRYCGEPDINACEACYSDIGGNIEQDIRPSALRMRSHGVLTGANRVVVPSRDVADRLQRYFPGISCTVTAWESDAALPARATVPRVSRLRLRVAVVGAIGIDKGYEYLLACARYAAAQRLALEFVVVGYTCDDKRLLETGTVHITGGYAEAEAVELIRAQQAGLGFLPALWPETWSYTLSQMWQADLDVVAFDLGAPADRIRETRRGRLLPLGLPPASACRALLAYRSGGDVGRMAAPMDAPPMDAAPLTEAVA